MAKSEKTEQLQGPICPFMKTSQCLGGCCELYNDDARGCVLSPVSLQILLKTAITDAATEVVNAYHLCQEDDRK